MTPARLAAALALALLAATLAPVASAEPDAPCTVSPPAHAGFSCGLGPVDCAFHIWLDLNPPNPTFDCLV